MRTNSPISTTAQPARSQPAVPAVNPSVHLNTCPTPGGSIVSWRELEALVLPLPAFLRTNSHDALIDPQAISEFDDPHPHRGEVRLCYRLNPRFFHEETSLDEALVAILRASRRGRTSRRWPLRVTTELTLNSGRSPSAVWSALVISSSNEIEREDCVNHVNRLLRMVLRPGCIRPLTAKERTVFGRGLTFRRR